MTPAEKNHSVCEGDALEVIFELKRFRVYLLSTDPFSLITDHQELKNAVRKKYMHGRLARWLKFLAEYEFEVCYHSGDNNMAADFLSRYATQSPEDCDEGEIFVTGETQEDLFGELEDRNRDAGKYLLGLDME